MTRSDFSDRFPDFTIEEIARLAAMRPNRPVEKWNPDHCGHSNMRILRDGSWLYQGSRIERPELVQLFSSILRREADGSYALVTPVEKLTIDVEDTPFIAVELKTEGARELRMLAFRLNNGEFIIAGKDHPLRLDAGDDDASPFLVVRPGLDTRLSRPVYYELAELTLGEGNEPLGLWSDGAFFRFDQG